MHDAPLVAAVGGGFALALVVAATYAAIAVVAVVVLHAQRRSREAAFLRTLGLSGRQVGLLTLVEQGLPLVLALVIGIGLGLALAWIVAPGIDLAAFSAPGATVILQVDWVSIAAVVGGHRRWSSPWRSRSVRGSRCGWTSAGRCASARTDR